MMFNKDDNIHKRESKQIRRTSEHQQSDCSFEETEYYF